MLIKPESCALGGAVYWSELNDGGRTFDRLFDHPLFVLQTHTTQASLPSFLSSAVGFYRKTLKADAHGDCVFRIITRSAPFHILATALTREEIEYDWRFLQRFFFNRLSLDALLPPTTTTTTTTTTTASSSSSLAPGGPPPPPPTYSSDPVAPGSASDLGSETWDEVIAYAADLAFVQRALRMSGDAPSFDNPNENNDALTVSEGVGDALAAGVGSSACPSVSAFRAILRSPSGADDGGEGTSASGGHGGNGGVQEEIRVRAEMGKPQRVCAGCKGVLEGEVRQAEGMSFHWACFVCSECGQPVTGSGGYAVHGTDLYCPLHVEAANAAQKEEEEEEEACVVCLDQPITQVIVPCGHLALCQGCADHLIGVGEPCPICRGEFERHIRVFRVV